MSTAAHVFDTHLAAFKEMQNAPWGKLRYSLALANLARHMPRGPLHILDAGGGNGIETILLAQQGHHLTLVDYSAEMLAEAQRHAQASGVADRITFHQSDLAGVSALFPEPVFDVVLCHNVLQYVEDVTELCQTLAHALKPNGLLSLIGVNHYSEVYRQALMLQNPAAALATMDERTLMTVIFGTAAQRYTGAEMRAPLHAAGCETIGEYGIRCVCDYIQNNEIKSNPAFFAQLEQLEHALTNTYPYYLTAKFFQVMGQKTAKPD